MKRDPAGAASLGSLQVAFAILSVVLLCVLAIAPATTHFSEWRAVQQRYNVLAQRAKLPPLEVRVRQITPAPDVVDRCGSCHLGAVGVAPVDGDPLFAAHPPIPHDPIRFGCTPCHGGQGRALTAQAAHNGEANFEEALLSPKYRAAACGRCHSHVVAPDPDRVESGQALFGTRGCDACHTVDGRDAATKRDLSRVGLRGYAREWHDEHVRVAAASTDSRWRSAPLPLPEKERTDLDAYLTSLIAAPQLMAGKLLVARLGCRGCHRIGGVGGDGPDLSDVGGRRSSDVDFSHVRGGRTLVDWLRAVLTEPSRLDPGSRMPASDLSPLQVDQMITYLLSLRTREIPAALWPRDRVRGMLLGERDFSVDGHALFLAFCSGCHGPRGEGRAPGDSAVVAAPAIGGAEFLAIAGDAFLQRTLREGRPEHRMPSWGASDGGLRPEEITAIVGYLRALQPAPPNSPELDASAPDLPRGRRVFHDDCSPCHGELGEGTAIGPPLAAGDNPVTTRESAIYGTLLNGVEGTAMGSFRSFDAPTLKALIGAVRALDRKEVSRRDWRPRSGDAKRGGDLFARRCRPCHGVRPGERRAPTIQDPHFIRMASDSFLTASIVRRHDRSREEVRPGPEEVADLVAYLRSLGAALEPKGRN